MQMMAWRAVVMMAMLGIPVLLAAASPLGFDVDFKLLEPRIIAERPHDPRAFTQGLELHGHLLYESTGGYGESTLREVDPTTGKVLRARRLPPNEFGEGLTIVGDKIYLLTWKEGRAHVFDRQTFERERTFRYEGEGWGLCYDGQHLIMSNGTDRLTWRDPETFDVVTSRTVTINGNPLPNINELEYVDGKIWANVWQSPGIFQIDPASGKVIAAAEIHFLTPEEQRKADVLNGIAWNPVTETFLITGKLWPKMYEVVFVPRRE